MQSRSDPGETAARHAAYRATAFRVDAPGGGFDLRVGTHAPELDALLDLAGARCWAYVTAHNPGGRLRDAAANEADQRRLAERVRRTGLTAIAGRGIGANGGWPPEESLLILDLARDAAIALAREFGQEALVAGNRGGVAELVFC